MLDLVEARPNPAHSCQSMKGRRRARRVALQGLYELDVTRHDLDAVLAGRMENLYSSAATGVATSPEEHRAFDHLVELCASAGLSGIDVVATANHTGLTIARLSALVTYVASVREQAVYMTRIIRGVMAHLDEIDRVIQRIAPEWPVSQMAPIDRNLLRIALWELGSHATPVRVAISEAVELARQFSGEGARRMVNGALGAYVSGDYQFSFDESTDTPTTAPQEGD